MILRRLYLYLVSAAGLGLLAAGAALLGVTVLLFVFNDPSADSSRTQLAGFTAMTLVALPVWGVHFWFARRSAMRNPYERASAIRRLYVYWACLASLIGALIAIAIAAGDLLRPLIDTCPFQGIDVACPASPHLLATSQAGWVAIVFLAIWAFHFRVAARDRSAVGEAGASATLRRWYMYGVLLIALLVMLYSASSLIELAWLRVAKSSLADYRYLGDPAGLRRLYTNLVALVSRGAWAVGAGGLLWTLGEQAEAPSIGVPAGDWKNPVSLWLTLLVVGAVVWLAHWRPSPWAADRQALPRRLYVWAALLASVLVVLGAGVGMLAAVLRQAFSAHPALADSANLDFGHYLGVILIAAGVGFYHWRVLRADSGARSPISHTEAKTAPVGAVVAAAVPVLIPAPEVADPNTRRYLLSVTDATEDDVHQALSSLPPHAAYKLTPTDKSAVPVDGR